ncbi:MAG: twin-arginine translocation signal domain-containing protein [Gammaproteobacteria bacterium]|nr:twin-arginine translocation signal domain-containing protein [Gammaproteobacteria bacterium]MBU1724701.1 twin-arginine translocation signal domain-containing protein [Gammaproteobacteria bacterium]MBU2005023.1 twin-arginine translocation signal domain-containing protein [Gammaproteobacteria bacterium]
MKTRDKTSTHNPARREFLRGTMAAGAGAALLAAAPGIAEATPATISPEPEEKKAYRLTPHIAAYYKTAAM